MSHYLRQHPEVFFSKPKEPHHFLAKEMPRRSRYPSEKAYADLFTNATTQHKVVAEGSVWYLYSKTAVENIHHFDSDAKFIIMLRRPDDMVYSMHNQFVITHYEHITDFATAWQQALTQTRTEFTQHCLEPDLLKYDEIAAYAEQLARVYETVPKDQVHVIFFEDFKENTATVFADTCDFLGIDTAYKPEFEKVNENQTHRSALLGRFVQHPPARVRAVMNAVKSTLGIHKLGLKPFIRRFNYKNTQRPALSKELRTQIINHYRDDIKKLETLTGKDLGFWLQ